MKEHQNEKKYTTKVSESFEKIEEHKIYEVPFRRWLVKEIEEKRMSISEAIAQFNFMPSSGRMLIGRWISKYGKEMIVSLPTMTEKEKQELEVLQNRLRDLEKQIEDAQQMNLALNTLIDVAEEKLKISIRKKPGAKQ